MFSRNLLTNMWKTNLIVTMKIIMEVFHWRKKVGKFRRVWKLCILWKLENRRNKI